MLVFKVQIYIANKKEPWIGHWKTIGFIRSPVYSRKSALKVVESIPELWQMTRGHALEFEVSIWNRSHTDDDSITSWIWRVRRW